jgi:hypothetical protein
MEQSSKRMHLITRPRAGRPAAILLAAVLLAITLVAYAADPLDIAGYQDHSYGSAILEEPTDKSNQSKVWWNDEYWWGVLYNPEVGEYHIYQLDALNQEWVDTGVFVDEREEARADALWDEGSQKLYILTHYKRDNPTAVTGSENWARLLRYSYSAGDYTLDAGFEDPYITVNRDRTKSVVLDKDSTGILWVTYVSREAGSEIYNVYVNHSSGDDLTWGDAYVLPMDPQNSVTANDISSLVAFDDAGPPKIGVAWSNQIDFNFYFATHTDGGDPMAWSLEPGFTDAVPYPSDDHIDFAVTDAGQVITAIKTGTVDPLEPLELAVARDSDGSYSTHPFSSYISNDTRPIVTYDSSDNSLLFSMTSRTAGGNICYMDVAVPTPLSSLVIPYDNCPSPADGAGGEIVVPGVIFQEAPILIGDNTLVRIDNATSTKQALTEESGYLVLASDDENGSYYVHNLLGGDAPPPPPPPGDHFVYLPVIKR